MISRIQNNVNFKGVKLTENAHSNSMMNEIEKVPGARSAFNAGIERLDSETGDEMYNLQITVDDDTDSMYNHLYNQSPNFLLMLYSPSNDMIANTKVNMQDYRNISQSIREAFSGIIKKAKTYSHITNDSSSKSNNTPFDTYM